MAEFEALRDRLSAAIIAAESEEEIDDLWAAYDEAVDELYTEYSAAMEDIRSEYEEAIEEVFEDILEDVDEGTAETIWALFELYQKLGEIEDVLDWLEEYYD
jgi:lipopolysaccharide biosynthesis regulator YciM